MCFNFGAAMISSTSGSCIALSASRTVLLSSSIITRPLVRMDSLLDS